MYYANENYEIKNVYQKKPISKPLRTEVSIIYAFCFTFDTVFIFFLLLCDIILKKVIILDYEKMNGLFIFHTVFLLMKRIFCSNRYKCNLWSSYFQHLVCIKICDSIWNRN